MTQLKVISREDVDSLVSKREGETKLGEVVKTFSAGNWEEELTAADIKYVLLGIPEDIGVRANLGVGGAQSLWQPALKSILNVQATDGLAGLAILGAFDFTQLMQQSANASVDELRKMVATIDEAVYPVIRSIVKAGKIPIVIGGGHNNAYPLLKGTSEGKRVPVNCMNLDAHSDYRRIEGRHSGNGFRYAKNDGYLYKYAIIGLHRNYNSQAVLEEITTHDDIHCIFYEDIFLYKDMKFNKALAQATMFTSGAPVGVELDLDCIERTLSSAATPSGITTLQARKYITAAAMQPNCTYLHLTEGVVKLADGREDPMTAKLVAYLVTDFMRTYMANY